MTGALHEGSTFLGRPTRNARVLLLTEERGATLRDKQHRLRGAPLHVLHLHERGDRSWPQVVAEARDYCREHGIEVLIVDVLDKWAGFRGEDDIKTGKMLEAIRPLMDAAGEGLAVLVNVHERKAGGSHGDGVKGNNALTGSVDVIVEVERAKEPLPRTARILRCESRFEATPDELTVELTEDGYQALGTVEVARKEAEVAETQERLAELDGGVTVAEYMEATGLKEQTARRRLNDAVKAGVAERTEVGKRGEPHRFQILSTSTQSLDGGKKTEAESSGWTPEGAEAAFDRTAGKCPEVALAELEPELHNDHATLGDSVLAAERRRNGDG